VTASDGASEIDHPGVLSYLQKYGIVTTLQSQKKSPPDEARGTLLAINLNRRWDLSRVDSPPDLLQLEVFT
jgi:hypothetical protein